MEVARRLRLTLHLLTRGAEARARRRGHKARRWVVERTHSWLNRFRRLLVCWGKESRQLRCHAPPRLRYHRRRPSEVIRIDP